MDHVTVCICTQTSGTMHDCLQGLRQQVIGPDQFDILVVDSASTGAVPEELARLVSGLPNARLLRVEQAGVSVARNAGALEAEGDYIAYIDDDAIPAPDWIARILQAIGETASAPALIGGCILPHWEAPLPGWWPHSLRGALSIRANTAHPRCRPGLSLYGANMVVLVRSMLAIGGFGRQSGRFGNALLSDEEVQLAWRLQDRGYSGARPFAYRGAAPDPGGPADAYLAAVAALLAGRVDGTDAPATRSAGRRVAGAAAAHRSGGAVRSIGFAAPPQHAPARMPLAARLCAWLHPRSTWLARSCIAGAGRRLATMQLYHWQGAQRNFGDGLNRLIWPNLLPGFFDSDPAEVFLGIGSVP